MLIKFFYDYHMYIFQQPRYNET